MATKTTWKMLGKGTETRIAELRIEIDNKDQIQDYITAKLAAIEKLREEMKPLQKRLEELESDQFKEAGKRPELKVWTCKNELVAAKTKKRAAKLAYVSRNRFNSEFRAEEDGDWWYEYAREEGLWAKERKADGRYLLAITFEEQESLFKGVVAEYKAKPAHELLLHFGRKTLRKGTSLQGTPYEIEIGVSECDWDDDRVSIVAQFDDLLDRRFSKDYKQALIRKPSEVTNWLKEGF